MKIVVAGGGFGGVKTALELANKPGVEVILISPTSYFEYHGALYRSATGHSPLEVVIPLHDIFRHARNVQLLLDKVTSIDPEHKLVVTEMGDAYTYDSAVLALGNVVNYFGIPGMAEHAEDMNTIHSTIALRHQLAQLLKSRKQKITIAVIGAGATGVELAGELPNFIRRAEEKYLKAPKQVEVVLVEGADRVLPMMLPKASHKAEQRLRKLGVDLKLNTKVEECHEDKLCLPGKDLQADLIIWTAGSRAVDFYANHPNVFHLERGRVKVDEFLQVQGQNNIYVIGDNAFTPFSGMAQTALHDAKFVAHNLLREQNGTPKTHYRVLHPVYVIPIGPRWAILQTKDKIVTGIRGWAYRRRADLQIFENFEPYKQAVKTWRQGNRLVRFLDAVLIGFRVVVSE